MTSCGRPPSAFFRFYLVGEPRQRACGLIDIPGRRPSASEKPCATLVPRCGLRRTSAYSNRGGCGNRGTRRTPQRQGKGSLGSIKWRRGGDSNSRWPLKATPVFETGPFNRSGTSPLGATCRPCRGYISGPGVGPEPALSGRQLLEQPISIYIAPLHADPASHFFTLSASGMAVKQLYTLRSAPDSRGRRIRLRRTVEARGLSSRSISWSRDIIQEPRKGRVRGQRKIREEPAGAWRTKFNAAFTCGTPWLC
jgi:hypothetical protein